MNSQNINFNPGSNQFYMPEIPSQQFPNLGAPPSSFHSSEPSSPYPSSLIYYPPTPSSHYPPSSAPVALPSTPPVALPSIPPSREVVYSNAASAIRAYCEQIPRISFFDAFANSTIILGTNTDFYLQYVNFKHEFVNNTENILLKIVNDEQKIKKLSSVFDSFILQLTEMWSSKKFQGSLTGCLHYTSPDIVFNLSVLPTSDLVLIKPLLNFIMQIKTENILSNLELKLITTIICDCLNIFLTHSVDQVPSSIVNPEQRSLWNYLKDALLIKGKCLQFKYNDKMKFNQEDYSLFLTLFLRDLKNLKIETLLKGYTFRVYCSSSGNKIITAYHLSKVHNTADTKEIYKLMILPKNVPGENNKKEVSLYALKVHYQLNIPIRFSQLKRLNHTKTLQVEIETRINRLINGSLDFHIHNSKLLVDNRCDREMLSLALQKCKNEEFEKPLYNHSYAHNDSIYFLPIASPFLKDVKIQYLIDILHALPQPKSVSEIVSNVPIDLSNLPPSASASTPPSSTSPLSDLPSTSQFASPPNPESSLEFYHLNLADLTLEMLKKIEIPMSFKMKWANQLKQYIDNFSNPDLKKELLKSLKHSLETKGQCYFDINFLGTLDRLLPETVIRKLGSEITSTPFSEYEKRIQNKLFTFIPLGNPASFYLDRDIPSLVKPDYSILDINELCEILYQYFIDSLHIKANNTDLILKMQRFDLFKGNTRDNSQFPEQDLLPPKAKPCFYLVRPPEEENPEIHCFQIYINENYDIYAIGKESPENEVSTHLAKILGCDRNLLLPSSYGEGFSLKNGELDLLWKYYAAHPEEFILLSNLSSQSEDDSVISSSKNVKGKKTSKKRSIDSEQKTNTPTFPDKAKIKRKKTEGIGSEEPAKFDLSSEAHSSMIDEELSAFTPTAVLPSMPLASSSYQLPTIQVANVFAAAMFKLTMQSMEFVKRHLEKVEKATIKTDDELFNMTAPLRQKIKSQTPAIPDFYCSALKQYQQESAIAMLNLSKSNLGGILAAEPGLGKTFIAIEWIMQLQKSDVNHKPILIVVPKTITSQWREAFYQQNFIWLHNQFNELIQKAKLRHNLNIGTLCVYLETFLESHLNEISNLEKKLKEFSASENGEENVMQSYLKGQLETRYKWRNDAQALYDDLFFNVPIIPHMVEQWKKEISQNNLSLEELRKKGKKFGLIASNMIEKICLRDISDWNSRVEKGLKAFGHFKYKKLSESLNQALLSKSPNEIRQALSYSFQFFEDVNNLGQLLQHLLAQTLIESTAPPASDNIISISDEIGLRCNFYNLAHVISEPPKYNDALLTLKDHLKKPYTVLITTKDILRMVKRKKTPEPKLFEKVKEKENFITFLKTLPWGGVIWDEVQLQVWDLTHGEQEIDVSFAFQFLKNFRQNSSSVPILLLTGTPFVNNYGETLSLFSMSNPEVSLHAYGTEIANREARLKIALEKLERAKKIQIESQEKNTASFKRHTRSILKCLENVIIAYAHMKKVQSHLVKVNRFEDQNVQSSWTNEQGIKLLPQKEAIEITCPLKPKQKELIRTIQQGFKAGEKSLFRFQDTSHKIVFHPDLNGKKLATKSNPELEAIKKRIKAFNPEEQNRFIEESGFLNTFFKGSEEASPEMPSNAPLTEALKTRESILIIISRIFEGVILKQLLENQFEFENRNDAKIWFLDGTADTVQREHMVRCYETSSYFTKIFILSLKTGGVGLDLKTTTIGFNLASKWAQWNNSGLLQAEARMFRANTSGVKRMYSFNSGTLIEQCVHHAVVGKKLFSQFLFYSEESIKKEIGLYLSAFEARCIKTEIDLSVENMEERKGAIHALFEMVRKIVEEAPPKYFDAFQKRLSMATDLNYSLSQEYINRSISAANSVGNSNTENGVKRKLSVERPEVNKGKKNKTGVLPAGGSQLESKSSLPQGSTHSPAAAPIASVAVPLTSTIPLTAAIPSFNAPSSAAAASFTSSIGSVGNVLVKPKKHNSFSNRVAGFSSQTLFQPKLSQSGQGIAPLKTHYEVAVSGGTKINLSIVPLRDCFDIKDALQIGVGVSKNGQKVGSLLKAMRNLPSLEWQSLLDDPEAFMKTNHQIHDLNVNAVKTIVPTLFGIEQNALQSPISQEEILKSFNSDIYVFKDGKLMHEKGLRATNPSSSTCTIRLLKLPLAGSPNRFKFHLLMK